MYEMELGRVIDVRLLQLAKVAPPMPSRELGRVIVAKLLQNANTLPAIYVTDSGIMTDFSPVQL